MGRWGSPLRAWERTTGARGLGDRPCAGRGGSPHASCRDAPWVAGGWRTVGSARVQRLLGAPGAPPARGPRRWQTSCRRAHRGRRGGHRVATGWPRGSPPSGLTPPPAPWGGAREACRDGAAPARRRARPAEGAPLARPPAGGTKPSRPPRARRPPLPPAAVRRSGWAAARRGRPPRPRVAVAFARRPSGINPSAATRKNPRVLHRPRPQCPHPVGSRGGGGGKAQQWPVRQGSARASRLESRRMGCRLAVAAAACQQSVTWTSVFDRAEASSN